MIKEVFKVLNEAEEFRNSGMVRYQLYISIFFFDFSLYALFNSIINLSSFLILFIFNFDLILPNMPTLWTSDLSENSKHFYSPVHQKSWCKNKASLRPRSVNDFVGFAGKKGIYQEITCEWGRCGVEIKNIIIKPFIQTQANIYTTSIYNEHLS